MNYNCYSYFRKRLVSTIELSFNCTVATTTYLPGRIRPASKTPLKRPKKQMLSLIWLHTGTMVCCTSSNQNVARATMIYLPGRNRPVEFDQPQKHL